MELLAKAIKLAAKLREESFNDSKAEQIKKVKHPDYSTCYDMPLRQAADIAAEVSGFDKRGTEPIYLLLKHCWNDILEWADLFDN